LETAQPALQAAQVAGEILAQEMLFLAAEVERALMVQMHLELLAVQAALQRQHKPAPMEVGVPAAVRLLVLQETEQMQVAITVD
jgi:hypothetical protein